MGVSDAIVSNIPQQIDAYILNVMAKTPSLHGKPDTFEELALKLITCVPKGVNEVHVVDDCYLHNSIKAAERKARGENRAVIMKSVKSKIPTDFQTF